MNKDQFTLPERSDSLQPFDAPKDYFDAFPNRVSYRIQAGTKSTKRFDVDFIFRPIAITTILMVVLGSAILTFYSPTTDKAQSIQSEETLLSYVEQEGILDELSEDELVDHFFEEGVTSVENDEDSLSIEITEELVNDDFIDFETYDEL
ncbi:MAG: hypothetical protein ACK5B6_03465 [Bacteroidia bacterium]|jgi:hypothetical protein